MRSLALVVVALAAACSSPPPPADPAPRPARTYTAEVLFQNTAFVSGASSGHAFTPDGTHVLVNSDQTGVFNAYAVPVAGGAAVALTGSTDNATFGQSFFPADGRLLYIADQGGNELTHLWVRELDGTLRDLTPGEHVKASFVGWQRDGSAFFVATNERDARFFDLYRYAADGYARTLVFRNDLGYEIDAVSRDGRYLAATRQRTNADSDVYVIDLTAGGEPRHLTPHDGNVQHGVADFTPDGAALHYFTDAHGEFQQVWSVDLASGERAPVLAADWDVMYSFFSPSGRYRVSAVNADARTAVTITDTRTGEPVGLPELPPGDIANVRFSGDESAIAFLLATDRAPSNLHVVDLAGATHRQLTNALNPAVDPDDLVDASIVRYRSFDGLEIPGVMYRPHQASAENPVPAIVWVHGGPGGQSRTGYSAAIQHLVNHGYAVFAANNRGSSGYGKTFYHLDDRDHGGGDLRDIVAAGDFLRGLDWVRDDAVAVLGGSYGGFMTAAALAFHPDAFDVGINIFGVTNWVRTLESIPAWWESFREALFDEMGDPAVDHERHRAISPLFHAERITKPLLVVQGANDPRVLQVESDEIVAAVRANGVPVEYLLFPDEGHGFLKRENRIAASEAYLRFLEAHLR